MDDKPHYKIVRDGWGPRLGYVWLCVLNGKLIASSRMGLPGQLGIFKTLEQCQKDMGRFIKKGAKQ